MIHVSIVYSRCCMHTEFSEDNGLIFKNRYCVKGILPPCWWDCKLVTTTTENIVKIPWKTKNQNYYMIQQSHPRRISRENHNSKGYNAPQCSSDHYLKWPRHGSNLKVHWHRSGQRRCGTCIQWDVILKKNEIMPSVASWMDSDTVILSEVREGQIYDNTHTWNKRYTWTYWQIRHKHR